MKVEARDTEVTEREDRSAVPTAYLLRCTYGRTTYCSLYAFRSYSRSFSKFRANTAVERSGS